MKTEVGVFIKNRLLFSYFIKKKCSIFKKLVDILLQNVLYTKYVHENIFRKEIHMKKLLSILFLTCSCFSFAEHRISWEAVGALPAQKSYDKNIGTAGLLQGMIDDYVIVGGGANFPIKPLTEGGSKVTHKDIYLLKESKNGLKLLEQIQWNTPIGYGASVSTGKEIYYLGGSPEAAHNKDVLKVSVKNGKMKIEKVAELTHGFENGVATYQNGKIYYGVGKIEHEEGKLKNSNRFFVLDLKTGENKELAAFPGEARQQTVGQVLSGKFYVFSGGSSVSYIDGYAYDFEKNVWEKVADVVVNGEKILLLGANSVKISEDEMLVIGGFNHDLWNEASDKLSNLKDKELADYKAQYFGKEPFRYGWNRKILVFNAKENRWRSIGEVPFDAPCGAALLKHGNILYSINGEIKPGVRTPRIFRGEFR